MKKLMLMVLALSTLLLTSCQQSKQSDANKYETKTAVDSSGYSYEFVTNDPTNTRIYTLKNGLKIYLSKNEMEPRVMGLIAVNAGAKDDPSDNTGLAHYLEHLMFKGTSKLGSVNWEEEKKYLDQIEELFEKRKFEKDSTLRETYYHQIDSISQIAAKYAAPNEYDKLMTMIGAKYTNAGTGMDMTTYINNIPSNEVNRWLEIESERFSDLVLRLFHTELETVYEEYNMYQSEAWSVVNHAFAEEFYKHHRYGIDIIGTSEHLKSPSMKNIKEFFNTYYVPNNMAIVLSGDIDYEQTIKAVDQYWGTFKASESIPRNEYQAEAPIEGPIEKEVFTQDAEYVQIAFRTPGVKSDDNDYYELIDQILSNSKAGLIDLDLVQQQKVLRANSYSYASDDYGQFVLRGVPREGQSLEEVKNLLLEQLDLIKKGQFEDWLLEAIIDNNRVQEIQEWEQNWRAYTLAYNFHRGITQEEYLTHYDKLAKITKQQLIDFANEHFKNNYVVVYKRQGENKNLVRMEKPEITPIDIDRDKTSEYYNQMKAQKVGDIEPVFVDFKDKITIEELTKGIELDYIQNKDNELFSMYYIIESGASGDQYLKTAIDYLPFVGTSTMSADSVKKLMFKLAVNIGVGSSSDMSYVYFSGLNKNFNDGLALFKQILTDAKGDSSSYQKYVDGVLKKRSDNKKDKDFVFWNGMFQYGQYGPENQINSSLTENELRAIDAEQVMSNIHQMNAMPKHILYYGPMTEADVKAELNAQSLIPNQLVDLKPNKKYEQVKTESNRVLFYNYDMVQSDLAFLYIDVKFNPELRLPSTMFNNYYGGSMASVVFQEIRESKGLAYSSFASYSTPTDTSENHVVYAYVGTQPDKIDLASSTMLGLMKTMPKSEKNFEDVKESIKKRMRTERYTTDDIFWAYLSAQRKGLKDDGKKEIWDKIDAFTMSDLEQFFQTHVTGKPYTMIVIGSKDHVDFKTLEKFGKVTELSAEDIFPKY
ncbi:MAG: insulinase family protein [Bacteroidales bacterium]|nr:insulinase family protein [Bacteroidales bacterium]